MKTTFGSRVINYNMHLAFKGSLPNGFQVMNPFEHNPDTVKVMKEFYTKYFSDNNLRTLILGINPGRHGAGVTGIPFTDTKRLKEYCGIEMESAHTHEISSVFIYDMIEAYGGVEAFYNKFYINSPFPLAIIRQNTKGNWVNANYYDDNKLFAAVQNYMIEQLKKDINIGVQTKKVIVLGKKNADYIEKLNKKAKLFDSISVLPHPRYIQQYHSKEQQKYVDEYLQVFRK